MVTDACICRPRDPEGWYREDCPVHGREAEEAHAKTRDPRTTHAAPESDEWEA